MNRMLRCLVHALPFGGTHVVGPEDGMAGARRQPPAPEAAPSTVRSSQVLIGLALSCRLLRKEIVN